ncbi:flagellar biosynthetic protein FliO [Halobacillus sp. A1]|uniref:flagellar biosynthetic protein FliO n=1 Tax=Halobacillus sp. A1 TaxID=2880262 RepID=UPI0020A62902|nr:flagellar biosynthetic protein FliO [Halobacillus sp. A1]MCP3031206.1 flagellar biosynthetic protein FliO [Halobacillus sp. A1]
MMRRTIQSTALLFMAGAIILSFGSIVSASPSVTDCAENPEMQGCGSDESGVESPGQEIPSADSEENPSMIWNIIKLIFALLLVLALIYGLLKFFNKRSKMFQKNRTMETLGGVTLAPNRSLQAVRIGNEIYVVGVGDSINLITEITDQATKDTLVKQEEHPDIIQKGFGEFLKNRAKSNQNQSGKSSTVQFQQLFEKQLNEMKENRRKSMNRKDDQS